MFPLSVASTEYHIYDSDNYLEQVPDTPLTDDEIENGTLTLERMLNLLRLSFSKSIQEMIAMLPGFLLVVIMGAVCMEFSALPGNYEMRSTASAVVNMITFLYLLQQMSGLYQSVSMKIQELMSYGTTLSSIISSFLVFGGNYSSAGILLSFMVILCSFLAFLSSHVFPGVCAMLVISSLSGLGSENHFGGAAKLITNTYMTFCGAALSLLTLFVSFQSKVASGTDSVVKKGAKIASTYAIPVIGGAISESVDNISAGFMVLKNSFGFGAAAVIILSVFPCLLSVLLHKLVFAVIGTFCEIAGNSATGKVLAGMDSLFSVLLITLALNAISYLYCLILFCGIESGL